MREQLEMLRFAEQQKAQQTVAAANEEVTQLKAAVQALRDEMDRVRSKHDESVQAIQTASRNEIRQLQRTIMELRECLEKQDVPA